MEKINHKFPKSIEMVLTSNHCYLHAKPIQMMRLDDVEICPTCQLQKENQAFQLQIQNEVLKSEAKKRKNSLERRSVYLDESLRNASFGNFYTKVEEEQHNKEQAIKAYQQYVSGQVFTTFIQGDTGVGKSHLAMSILRNLNAKLDVECVFVNVREMMLRIRDSFDNKESRFTQLYFTELLSRVDYLCLDDLGAETGAVTTTKAASNFTLEVLTSILEARQKKATIITSNLSRKQMKAMYDAKLISRSFKNIALIKFEKTTDKRIRIFDLDQKIST